MSTMAPSWPCKRPSVTIMLFCPTRLMVMLFMITTAARLSLWWAVLNEIHVDMAWHVAPMASRTAKSLAGIRCFRRPREWFSVGTEHLLLLLQISSQRTRQIVEPSWSSVALANSLDRKYILPSHLRLLLLAFPHFTPTESHIQTNATRRTAWKKFALAERQRARNTLIFRCGCKHETPRCKRLKVKWRINFATRLIFLGPSHANFDFLFSNFAVRDFILSTLDFNT